MHDPPSYSLVYIQSFWWKQSNHTTINMLTFLTWVPSSHYYIVLSIHGSSPSLTSTVILGPLHWPHPVMLMYWQNLSTRRQTYQYLPQNLKIAPAPKGVSRATICHNDSQTENITNCSSSGNAVFLCKHNLIFVRTVLPAVFILTEKSMHGASSVYLYLTALMCMGCECLSLSLEGEEEGRGGVWRRWAWPCPG